MSFVTVMPVVALIGLLVFVVLHAKRVDFTTRNAWILPAVMSAVFLAFSVVAVMQEGLTGFWPNHTQNLWGNQVWFDLLFGFGLAWTFLVPRAKAAGMNVWLWLLSLLATGCIGLLAMTARLFYLERKAVATSATI